MTRMAGHKISTDGTSIVCTARPDALCRAKPDCDTETWGESVCNDHRPPHPSTPGHDCWAIEWTNTVGDLLYTYAYAPEPDICPGRDVVLTWQGDCITWAYSACTKEEA